MVRTAGHSGVDVCKILYTDFGESAFHALR